MSQNGKLMPNLDQQSTKILNLTVLQRIDPFVEEILITAAHVTFYEFNIDLNQWSRKDVEGSLFVVKRNTQPRFQFIVMNRRNTDNLVENLLGDFEYEVQVPYLLYRNAAQEVNGIWFYNARECEAVANLFNRIINAFSKVPPKPKVSTSKSEFEELEPTTSSVSAVIEGPLEPSSSVSPVDVPDDSFSNFFSAATNLGNSSNSTKGGQSHQSAAPIPLQSHSSSVPSGLPILQTPSAPPLGSSTPIMHLIDNNTDHMIRSTNLVKPFFVPQSSSASLIMPPASSSMSNAPPLLPPVNLQRPYGAPLLQPFPPPAPPPSLTPSTDYHPVITKEKVRDVLLKLAQNNHFIELVHQEILNAYYS